jgi:DnaJ-class molecular chaperone
MRIKTECPNCHGSGEQVDYADDMFGNTKRIHVPCDLCEGDGYMMYEGGDEQ